MKTIAERKTGFKSTGVTAVKNFFSLFVGNLLIHVLGFVTMAYLARRLAVDGFGRLVFAQAIAQYFALIGNFGLNRFGIREIARDKDRIEETVNCVVTLQTVLSILAALLLALFAFLLPRPLGDKVLISFYGFNIILTAVFLDWTFKGLEKMEIVGSALFLLASLNTVLVFSLVKNEAGILLMPLIAATSMAAAIAIPATSYIQRYGWPRPSFNWTAWRRALAVGLPIFTSIILTQVFYSLDTIMLGFMKTDRIVGLYSAAYKIIFTIISLGGLLQETLYPIVSRFYKDSSEKLAILLNISAKIYVSMAIPMGVGGTVLAKPMIELIYGKSYVEATVALQILIWSVVLILISFTFGLTLLACDQERKYMVGVALGAAANIIVNLFLIPPLGMIGAAIATVIAQALVTIYLFLRARRIAPIALGKYLLKPAIAATVMGVASSQLHFNVIANIFLSAAIYSAVFIGLGGIARQDLAILRRFLVPKRLG